MSNIQKINAYEIIDSRGVPTIEAKLTLKTGQTVVSAVPAGTSTGKFEAWELRDNDANRFDGNGLLKAIKNINEVIAPKLIGASVLQQTQIDNWLIKSDGTKNKSKFGANAILVISQLIAKAGALTQKIPLFQYINYLYNQQTKSQLKISKIPSPIFNIINGGKHANNTLEFQEFQVVLSSSNSFSKSYKTVVELYHELKRVLIYRNANISVGSEGGYAPNLSSNIDALEILNETFAKKKLKPGLDVFIGLDIGATNFYKDQRYFLKNYPHPLTRDDYIEMLIDITKQYSVLIFEDPLQEEDFKGWSVLNSKISKEIYLVGDDLLVTNKERLQKAINEKACNTILIKPNQIGTISETIEVINIAKKNNFSCIVSHRSGESNDTFIADFGVGVQSDYVKFGAPSRGERVAKYNRLWEIEREELKLI
jgi:enolase